MRYHTGYMFNKNGTTTIIGEGWVDRSKTKRIDGQRMFAVVGPRGGLRGWVTM